MKRSIFATVLLLSLGVILTVIGCGDDNPTGPNLIVGDTSDTRFQAADDFLAAAAMGDAIAVSDEISNSLLDAQFPGWEGTSSPKRLTRNASGLGDTTIVGIENYSFQNGWHIFVFSATVLVGVDTFATASGSDSVRVRADGTDMVNPDSTANELNIRAHFNWRLKGDTAGFQADHSLDLLLNKDALVPNITVNAGLSQNAFVDFTANPLTDSAAVCSLKVDFTGSINSLVFPLDTAGEAGECPSTGSLNFTANVNLNCVGSTTPDSLSVNGTWTVTATVLDNGDIQTRVSDGITAWTVTEPCDPNQGLGSPPLFTSR